MPKILSTNPLNVSVLARTCPLTYEQRHPSGHTTTTPFDNMWTWMLHKVVLRVGGRWTLLVPFFFFSRGRWKPTETLLHHKLDKRGFWEILAKEIDENITVYTLYKIPNVSKISFIYFKVRGVVWIYDNLISYDQCQHKLSPELQWLRFTLKLRTFRFPWRCLFSNTRYILAVIIFTDAVV